MINRVLIRLKVIQVIYAYYQNGSRNVEAAEKELFYSLSKAYDLYNYLLLLMVEVTRFADRRIDNRRHKLRPTEEDLNPNTRFIDNAFIAQLTANKQLEEFAANQKRTWDDEGDFVRNLFEEIEATEAYQAYMAKDTLTYEDDRELWRKLYASRLLRSAINNAEAYRSLMANNAKNWDMERFAFMDILIMQVALAEIICFPGIPVSVSLNEYVEVAKMYSTPKSGSFINGMLDNIVNQLKKENKLNKA